MPYIQCTISRRDMVHSKNIHKALLCLSTNNYLKLALLHFGHFHVVFLNAKHVVTQAYKTYLQSFGTKDQVHLLLKPNMNLPSQDSSPMDTHQPIITSISDLYYGLDFMVLTSIVRYSKFGYIEKKNLRFFSAIKKKKRIDNTHQMNQLSCIRTNFFSRNT